MAQHDAVFVGSGINALACAALLSRAGWNVCVLERDERLGGAIRTDDGLTAPGFTHEVLSSWHPLWTGSAAYGELKDELDRRGLEYLNTDLPTASAFPDGVGRVPDHVPRGQRRRAGPARSRRRRRVETAVRRVHGRRRPQLRRARDRALVAGRARARSAGVAPLRSPWAARLRRRRPHDLPRLGDARPSQPRRRTGCWRPGCSTRD